jgi:hypothetical protein
MSESDKCKSLYAWVDKIPGPRKRPTLYVSAIVNAPTPCHRPYATYVGDEEKNPPVYLLQLGFTAGSEMSPQVEADRELRYVQHNYSESNGSVELIFSDDSTKSVCIQEVS